MIKPERTLLILVKIDDKLNCDVKSPRFNCEDVHTSGGQTLTDWIGRLSLAQWGGPGEGESKQRGRRTEGGQMEGGRASDRLVGRPIGIHQHGKAAFTAGNNCVTTALEHEVCS